MVLYDFDLNEFEVVLFGVELCGIDLQQINMPAYACISAYACMMWMHNTTTRVSCSDA